MGIGDWKRLVDSLQRALLALSFRDIRGRELEQDPGFALWRDITLGVRERGRTAYLIGNGASASIASHFAADLAKNAHVHTQVFSDLSLLTAIANDLGYESVFSVPLGQRARAGDMLVAISSSGNSGNVLKAVDVARALGVTVVTLSSMAADNPLRSKGDLNAFVPADSYALAESGHATILHCWMDSVELQPEGLPQKLAL
jgi:D-sedoheptulose 7-phosphate isomerase